MQVGTATSVLNPTSEYLNSQGTWVTYILVILVVHFILLCIPLFTTAVVWTLTCTFHNVVCSYHLIPSCTCRLIQFDDFLDVCPIHFQRLLLIPSSTGSWFVLSHRGSRQETLDLGFMLTDTRQRGVPVILRELMPPDGFDPVSPSFTILTCKFLHRIRSSSLFYQRIVNDCSSRTS
ncbi:unnamed protein product [Schistosoma curassoni]|uniref:Transmembrane protein n=1 Tax=Schistosoma curassoni TaxID=6186 RepID=A0A183K6W0_9TREM|nr:unnamed protein product [Schistosoma curassoni]